MLPNSVVNVFCRVSVRTNVPEMNVTPSTIASAVSASLSLWASRPLIVTFRMSGRQRSHPLQDRIGGRLVELAHYRPVGQEDHPVRVGGTRGVVRHHHDRLAEFGDRLPQEGEHVGRGVGVEVARRLVGKDEGRLVDQRPGARDALLLAAGKLTGTMRETVSDTELFDQVVKPV